MMEMRNGGVAPVGSFQGGAVDIAGRKYTPDHDGDDFDREDSRV